jgi:ubiquinone/menaquinone biosynthesis C-methylase UbiE
VAARDPKHRFTDRVDDYVRYRPGYPRALVDLLVRECGLGPGVQVADVGSGTGIFTRLLLDEGAAVFAVEPNHAMRSAAERSLAGAQGFTSVDGSAEATTLPDESIDLVTAAQAFHWFDPVCTRDEMLRILRPQGQVVLVWNQRKASPFNDDYERMLERFAPEYAGVRERDRAADDKLRPFFAPAVPRVARFEHQQRFDRERLHGRLRSSSYAPREGDRLHAPVRAALDAIFDAHARAGEVVFLYETLVYVGGLRAPSL